jgi:uncharacterized membrane protein YfcA
MAAAVKQAAENPALAPLAPIGSAKSAPSADGFVPLVPSRMAEPTISAGSGKPVAMTTVGWVGLSAVFLVTAAISVVTGGTSLITVPIMMQLGMDPHAAVATNMLALVFLSLGGTLPFLKSPALVHDRLPALIVLTLIGSVLGALLLLVVPAPALPLVIAVAMIAIAVFSMGKRNLGLTKPLHPPARRLQAAGYAAMFFLGIYGGFFSGGYVALLTAVCVGCFGMTFLEAVAATKVLNLFSSVVATAIFAWQGLIDWKLGLLLSVVSFVGAAIGAATARGMSNRWLRRLFLTAVLILAVKILVFDVRWTSPSVSREAGAAAHLLKHFSVG